MWGAHAHSSRTLALLIGGDTSVKLKRNPNEKPLRRWHTWATAALLIFYSVEIAIPTTWMNVTDQTVVDQADVIAEVAVVSAEPISSTNLENGAQRVMSLYVLRAERCHKGCEVAPGAKPRFLVSEVGGGSGVVAGAPRYEQGRRYLVFLGREHGGVRSTIQQELGAVDIEPAEGAVMQLGPARAPAPDTIHNRLRERYGLPLQTDADGELGGASLVAPRYMAQNTRWRGTVRIKMPTLPPAGVTMSQAEQVVMEALLAWEEISGIRFDLSLTPRSPGKGPGFVCEEGVVNVSFDDPTNQIADPQNGTGAVALGGFCGGGTAPDGWNDVYSGALIFANGWASLWPQESFSHFVEIMTHELGHVLVLAHSAEPGQSADAEQQDASMYWIAHFDGRRGTVHSYDERAIIGLYPTPSPHPSMTASPHPTPTRIGGGGRGCGKKKTAALTNPERSGRAWSDQPAKHRHRSTDRAARRLSE